MSHESLQPLDAERAEEFLARIALQAESASPLVQPTTCGLREMTMHAYTLKASVATCAQEDIENTMTPEKITAHGLSPYATNKFSRAKIIGKHTPERAIFPVKPIRTKILRIVTLGEDPGRFPKGRERKRFILP